MWEMAASGKDTLIIFGIDLNQKPHCRPQHLSKWNPQFWTMLPIPPCWNSLQLWIHPHLTRHRSVNIHNVFAVHLTGLCEFKD